MKTYELRSDTFTKPVPAMRQAMADALVGDDVYREDPTVNQLEELAANLTGKEQALFVTSGSMGNLISLFINGGRMAEVLAHAKSHIFHHELASAATIAGVLPIGIDTPRGLLKAQVLEPMIKPVVYDLARTKMIEVENTIGGICYPLSTLKEIYALAKRRSLSVHMDGARIFNASIATGVQVSEIARYADTVTFCLSKGLGAPVGSMLCGSAEFIDKARSVRKMLGGGMRQSGILAAAGIYALHHHVQRLADDHVHAKRLAQALLDTSWARVCLDDVETNIVLFDVDGVEASRACEVFKRYGVLCTTEGTQLRFVTHIDVSNTDIDEVCAIIASIDKKEFDS
ncbi:MAG: low-specificity L-threonine aldolase [Spirochaetales bacterium]|nr:low-specificity L-threonine aldolase [Spirochaetales bacterium]